MTNSMEKVNETQDVPYNIYYVSLSTLPRGFSDKLKIIGSLQAVETDVTLEEMYDAIERGADENNRHTMLLNKYRFTAEQGSSTEGPDVYGIQTNEASIKSLLKLGKVLDEVILVASDMVYQDSGLQIPGHVGVGLLRDELDDSKQKGVSCGIQGGELDTMELDRQMDDTHPEEFYGWTNTLDYFLMEIRYFCQNVLKKKVSECIKKITIYPIDNDPNRGMMTNCAIDVATGILKAGENRKLQLYIDSNGGKRDLIIIQIAILRALSVHGIEADMVMYSNYTPGRLQKERARELLIGGEASGGNPDDDELNNKWGNHPIQIVDKKQEYEIFDVVSGIDEFVSNGRVEKLREYFKNSQSGIKPVLDKMEAMHQAFMTCFANDMINGVADVRNEIDSFKAKQEENDRKHRNDPDKYVQYKLADYVVSQIEDDLKTVFHEVGNGGNLGRDKAILPLIEWCKNKEFYQQAITLYIEEMPAWYVAEGLLKNPLTVQSNSGNTSLTADIADNAEFYNYLYDDLEEKVNAGDRDQQYQQEIANISAGLSHVSNADKKTYVIQQLNACLNIPGLSLNAQRVAEQTQAISDLYKVNGDKKQPGEDGGGQPTQNMLNGRPSDLSKYLNDLKGKYAYMSASSAGTTSGNPNDRSYTYIEKMNSIIDLADKNAYTGQYIIGSNHLQHQDYLKILQYYLAFKVLRNNSNHANGTGGANEAIVCQWLQSNGIIQITSGHLQNDQSVQLDYETTSTLLSDAINFNKSLI